jgi:hypothetical protein
MKSGFGKFIIVAIILVSMSSLHYILYHSIAVTNKPIVDMTHMSNIAWGVSRFESRFLRYESSYSVLYPEMKSPDRLRFVYKLSPNNQHIKRRGVGH